MIYKLACPYYSAWLASSYHQEFNVGMAKWGSGKNGSCSMLPFVGCWQRKTLGISAFPNTSRVYVGFTNEHSNQCSYSWLAPYYREFGSGMPKWSGKKKNLFRRCHLPNVDGETLGNLSISQHISGVCEMHKQLVHILYPIDITDRNYIRTRKIGRASCRERVLFEV